MEFVPFFISLFALYSALSTDASSVILIVLSFYLTCAGCVACQGFLLNSSIYYAHHPLSDRILCFSIRHQIRCIMCIMCIIQGFCFKYTNLLRSRYSAFCMQVACVSLLSIGVSCVSFRG